MLDMYGDSCEKLLEVLVVVIILSSISSFRGVCLCVCMCVYVYVREECVGTWYLGKRHTRTLGYR